MINFQNMQTTYPVLKIEIYFIVIYLYFVTCYLVLYSFRFPFYTIHFSHFTLFSTNELEAHTATSSARTRPSTPASSPMIITSGASSTVAATLDMNFSKSKSFNAVGDGVSQTCFTDI